MTPDTILYRQIHPTFLKEGIPQSCCFFPSVKDNGRLSVSNGDMWTSEQSFFHYNNELGLISSSVYGLTSHECTLEKLEVDHDGVGFPEHVSIVFENELPRSNKEKIAKKLKHLAVARGILHPKNQGIL